MRLGQIARKLDLTTQELADYMESRFGQSGLGANSRLTEEELADALRHFAPHQAASFFTSEKNQLSEAAPEASGMAPEEPPASAHEPEQSQTVTPIQPQPESPPEPVVEVIKAPKVELSGLKVLGKIELPEKKKKADPPADATKENRRPGSAHKQPLAPGGSSPRKNPIALQREREARELLRKKQEEAKSRKEKKTNHYFKAIEQKQTTVARAPRLHREEVEVLAPLNEQPPPRTWWGKLMRWFNT
jgi:hypothetical protein